jgi:hypothetical protein
VFNVAVCTVALIAVTIYGLQNPSAFNMALTVGVAVLELAFVVIAVSVWTGRLGDD